MHSRYRQWIDYEKFLERIPAERPETAADENATGHDRYRSGICKNLELSTLDTLPPISDTGAADLGRRKPRPDFNQLPPDQGRHPSRGFSDPSARARGEGLDGRLPEAISGHDQQCALNSCCCIDAALIHRHFATLHIASINAATPLSPTLSDR